MPSDTLNRIWQTQQQLSLLPEDTSPPPHRPELLLIGCVDARLNIKNDLNIPDGAALIFRNVAALVAGNNEGEPYPSEAAVLEFAVEVMRVKDIVVMGHTDCGGIAACLRGHDPGTEHIWQYLAPLEQVREEVMKGGGNARAQARAMEEAAVCQSVANLLSYDAVQRAVRDARLAVHGWLVNTATKVIYELNHATGQFSPMTDPSVPGTIQKPLTAL